MKSKSLVFFLLLFATSCFAQGGYIKVDALVLGAKTQSQRLALVAPPLGMMVYQSDGVSGLYTNTPAGWTYSSKGATGERGIQGLPGVSAPASTPVTTEFVRYVQNATAQPQGDGIQKLLITIRFGYVPNSLIASLDTGQQLTIFEGTEPLEIGSTQYNMIVGRLNYYYFDRNSASFYCSNATEMARNGQQFQTQYQRIL